MKPFLPFVICCLIAATSGCGSPANQIPGSTTAADTEAVEKAQKEAAQAEMAQQNKAH